MDPSKNNAPAIRRIHTRLFYRELQGHQKYPQLEPALESQLDLESLARGFDFGWLDMPLHDRMTTIVLDALGRTEFVDLWVRAFSGTMRKKFLSSFTELMVPLSGGSVLPLARRSPRVYEHLTRDCGTLRWSSTNDELVLEGFPLAFALTPWALSMLGSFQASAVHLGRGLETVSLGDLDESGRTVSFRIYDDVDPHR